MINTEYVKCNICDSEHTRLLFKQRNLPTEETTYEFSVVQCKNCGLVYINPRPTFDEIGKFYPTNFVSYQFELFELDNQSTLRKKIISSITKSISLSRIHDVAKHISFNSNTKALDVGCGKGAYLYYIKKIYECQCFGVDFDQDSVEYCRKKLGLNDVLQGNVDIINEIKKDFDIITMWHFLEHEFNPLSTLIKITSRLKREGLLVIEVPNQESYENKIFKKCSYLYDVPRHLFHFSPLTITKLLEKVNLEVLKISFPKQAGGWIGTAQNVLFKGNIYKNMVKNAFYLLALGAMTFPIDYITSKIHKGSIIRVYAKK